MKLFLISVRDRKAGVYTPPNCVVRLEAGIRGFADEVNRADQSNMWFKHPEDFDLYHLGSFDDQTGRFEPLADPTLLGCGDEYIRQQGLPFGGSPGVKDGFYAGTGDLKKRS